MEKLVIIINGVGGSGKDTLCDLAAKHFRTVNISSITPIKEIASHYGWKGEKDARSRKFLSDLKRVFVEYNDLPGQYLLDQFEQFLRGNAEILFVHIREGEEIDKFRRKLEGRCRCIALLVERTVADQVSWGNRSDDAVRDYPYDYRFENNHSIEEAEKGFVRLLEEIRDHT